ncbi:hypothetical protein DYH09_03540 [bacterium CPR1]|nr:hypothetical protein [bacterium CPR1]
MLDRLWSQEGQLMQQARGEPLAIKQFALKNKSNGTLLRQLDGLGRSFALPETESLFTLEYLTLQRFELSLRLDELVAKLVDLGLELGKLLQAPGEGVLKPPLRLPGADQI